MPDVEWRQTRHQVARGTRPDAQDGDRVYLFKNVSTLRATYQIRLLTYMAARRGAVLIIEVPRYCEVMPSLARYLKSNRGHIRLERV